jgi:cell wall-associated NlpC family hydrolase
MTGGWVNGVPVPARVSEIESRIAPRTSAASSSDTTDLETELLRAQGTATASALTGASSLGTSSYGAFGLGALSTPYATDGYRSPSSALDATGTDVVPAALKYVGVPYVWGGNDPATGVDCSGFTKLVYGSLGVSLPRVSTDQATMGAPVASLAEARPGDLLAFGSPVDHVAIYLGNGRMVHAAGTGKGVRVEDVYRQPTAIRRLLPSSTPATGAWSVRPASITSASGDAALYEPLFAEAGARHGVDPALLSAVARAESGYNPNAVSRAGALGLMQIMPATAAGLGVDPLDPAQAIDGAARYLAQQLDAFGSTELALAAYNAGPAAVGRYGGIPPYPETQAYVSKVLGYVADTRSRIGALS